MNEPITERLAIWDDFLNRWPLENLSRMTLREYSGAGDKDCFTYWLEARTEGLGSIWGGSSFKFGVYARKDHTPKLSEGGVTYTVDYAWATKYGLNQEEAFARVLEEIVTVAQAARRGDLDAVEAADLGTVTKWKIAFLYQDRSAPTIVNIFKLEHLREAIGSDEELPPSAMHPMLAARRGSKQILEYGDELWNKIQEAEAALLTSKEAQQFFQESDRFSPIKPSTEKMAGFRSRDDRQIALALDNKTPTLYLGAGSWIGTVSTSLSSIVEYAQDKSRSSNIAANAPALAIGNAIVKVTVPTLAALVQLCDAYEGNEPSSAAELRVASQPIPSDRIPLNQILYGPPGTGKTYRTIQEALRIVAPNFLQAHSQDRTAQKRKFDELVRAEHVRFITFHQSFSYEDFVEGIRPVPDEAGQLKYEPVDGLFKLMCDTAQVQVTKRAEVPPSPEKRTIWKMSLGNTQLDESDIYEECIANGYALLGYGSSIDFSGCQSAVDVHRRYKAAGSSVALSDYAVKSVFLFIQKIKEGDLLVITDGNFKFRAIGQVTGSYEYAPREDTSEGFAQKRRVKWLRVYKPSLPYSRILKKQFVQRTLYELRPGTLDQEKFGDLLAGADAGERAAENKGGSPTPKVLIIDEINRGNVSRIFGELITLLEESKRKGQPEALEVVLPYSGDTFSIPDNVYLIGTMNSTDRSLTGLDIALRRRFSFVELPPQPELLDEMVVEGIGIGDLLRAINERVEVLLDREHRIGHAYFLPLKASPTLDVLALIFRRQILPLLQEYFFEDWSRIRLVLNDHRKPDAHHRFIERPGRSVEEIFGAGNEIQVADDRWTLNENAFKFAASYLGTVGDFA